MKARLLAAATPLVLLLASPAGASAIQINTEFKPQNEFKLDPWVSLKIGPIDLSINKAVLYLLLAAAATTLTMIYVANRMQAKPNRVQTVGTLFLFIWFSNMIGYLPLPTNTQEKVNIFGLEVPSLALYAATANISTPLVLTLIVWISYHVEGIRAKGFIGYVKGWIPKGTPRGLIVLVFPIEVISQFVRIISLSVRLFANILAGHLLILFMGGGLVVLLNLAAVGSVILGLVTGVAAVAFFLFEIGLIATLQAFIFATLTAIYLGESVAESH